MVVPKLKNAAFYEFIGIDNYEFIGIDNIVI